MPDGLSLSLGPTFTKTFGDTGESWTGYGVYVLEGDPGASLDELEQVMLALSRLQSIVTATPMETYKVQLRRDMELGALEILDPHPPAGLTWGTTGSGTVSGHRGDRLRVLHQRLDAAA
jgi:hypothetical protein